MNNQSDKSTSQKDIVLFYNGPFSQWFPSVFTGSNMFQFEGVLPNQGTYTFDNCEQWMMFQKALLFNDFYHAKQILSHSKPSKIKQLGRQVQGFNEKEWNKHKLEIVTQGNVLKFSQNPDLKLTLQNTGDKLLAEASEKDNIWGIGLASSHPNARNPFLWRGENLLGKAIMKAREIIFKCRVNN